MRHKQHLSVLALQKIRLAVVSKGVTVTAGLKAVFTTPAHGTAYDIVGQNKADPGAMEHAFPIASKMAAAKLAAHSRNLAI